MEENSTRRKTLEDYFSKRFERAVTAIFWDLDGCQIPDSCEAIGVSQKIRSALKQKNYLRTATIYAYGDTKQIRHRLEPDAILKTLKRPGDKIDIVDMDYRGTAYIYANQVQADLQSPEIVFNHTPAGDKDVRLKKLLIDLLCWATDNPGPANLMIILEDISTHRQFVSAFHRLRNSSSYKILLVQPQTAPSGQLLDALPEKWLWESLSEDGEFINILEPSSPEPLNNTSVGKPIRFLLAGAEVGAVALFVWIVLSRLKRSH